VSILDVAEGEVDEVLCTSGSGQRAVGLHAFGDSAPGEECGASGDGAVDVVQHGSCPFVLGYGLGRCENEKAASLSGDGLMQNSGGAWFRS